MWIGGVGVPEVATTVESGRVLMVNFYSGGESIFKCFN